jgi:hypothetical protein
MPNQRSRHREHRCRIECCYLLRRGRFPRYRDKILRRMEQNQNELIRYYEEALFIPTPRAKVVKRTAIALTCERSISYFHTQFSGRGYA